MRLKTGIFGGSFNPIHIGHLAIANYICEFEGLDELWFMVSPQNPFKRQTDLLEDAARLQLVQTVIQGYPKFQVSDFEFHLPKPSYTINTLGALKSSFPEREFQLIIGSDNWAVFDQWKDSPRIIAENKILIYPRKNFEVNTAQLPANVSLIQAPLIEVSSTFIRQAIRQGKDVRYFLPDSIYNKVKELL